MVRPELQAWSHELRSVLIERHDPERVFRYFDLFHAQHPQLLDRIAGDAALLSRVATVFRLSRFLSEELLRHPDWAWTTDPFARALSAADYQDRFNAFLHGA